MAVERSSTRRRGNYRPDQLLALASEADLVESKLKAMGLTGLKRENPDRLELVRFSWTSGGDAGAVVDELRDLCQQEWNGWKPTVSPNHVLARSVDPDTGRPTTKVIGASDDIGGPHGKAKATTRTLPLRAASAVAGTGVVVGVVDGGVVRNNEWLQGSYLAGADDFDKEAEKDGHRLDPQDGHGTFVGGIILQQAPGATLRVARVLDASGESDIQPLANAIERLGRAGCDIINVSAGGYTETDQSMMVFGRVLRSLPATTVVVASAGNHDPERRDFDPARPFYPAAMPDVVGVAALGPETDAEPDLAPFSNYGPWVTVSAHGTDVLSTFLTFGEGRGRFKGWATWSGTSFAAPRVAGAIAARMTENGVKVRSAWDARRLLLADAEGEPWDASQLAAGIASGRGPGPGRFIRLGSRPGSRQGNGAPRAEYERATAG
jgi:hypothetical protein